MAAVQAVSVLLFCAFAFNEANAAAFGSNRSFAVDLHRLRHHFERSEADRAKSMNAIMKTMTSHDALELLKRNSKASPELVALAQTAVSHTRLRATHFQAQVVEKGTPMRPPAGVTGADGAKWMINRLLEETMGKYDIEILKCRDFYARQCRMIEEARGTVSSSNFKSAQCRVHILGAQTQISVREGQLGPTKETMKDHKTKCKREVSLLHEKLAKVQGDIDVISNILAKTDCASSFIQTGEHVGVLRCKHECDKVSKLSLDHSELQSHIESLKSNAAQELLQENFKDLAGPADPKNSSGTTSDFRRSVVPPSPCVDPAKGLPQPNSKRAAKCTVAGSASCDKIRERFILIQSGLQDGSDNTKQEVVDTENSCQETADTLSEAVEKAEQSLKSAQTKLAEATGCENEASETGRLANKEFDEMSEELHKMKTECSNNYQSFENEICGLKKIRGEVFTKMKGGNTKPFFQDCKLSDWTPGECSATCGGGKQEMERSIDTQPMGGAGCLPLKQTRRCGEQPCPVDCKLSSWGGWSSCSAECGGGVQERLRDVEVPMRHNGEPCGATSDTKACNVQACTKDCELHNWTPWSKCSKECDGGTRVRHRHVKEVATGGGFCWKPHDPERENHMKCNDHPCPLPKVKPTITCEAKVDLILVLDGSGSLGSKGWAATKKAAALILGALEEDKAQVGVLLYSGPKTWSGVRKCFGNRPVNQATVCSMKWVQHTTTSIGATISKVEALSWPKGSTLTSLALMNALGETQLGRKDAETVVTVITDGKPLSKRRTWRAARSVRKVARLVWVPVTRYAPLGFIRRMASRPWRENVVPAKDFSALKNPKFVNKIIADICPKLAFS